MRTGPLMLCAVCCGNRQCSTQAQQTTCLLEEARGRRTLQAWLANGLLVCNPFDAETRARSMALIVWENWVQTPLALNAASCSQIPY